MNLNLEFLVLTKETYKRIVKCGLPYILGVVSQFLSVFVKNIATLAYPQNYLYEEIYTT